MAVTAVIGIVVAVVSVVAGTIQKSDAAKQAASQAAQAEQIGLYQAHEKNQTDIIIGQGHDIAGIYGAVAKAQLCKDAQVTVATRQQEGNVLIIVGAGIFVMTLAMLAFRKKKET